MWLYKYSGHEFVKMFDISFYYFIVVLAFIFTTYYDLINLFVYVTIKINLQVESTTVGAQIETVWV